MRLICLKCASPNCSCGRLALARLVRELRGEDDSVATASPSRAVTTAAEGDDTAAGLAGLLVLKLRYNPDLPKAFRGE